MILNKENLHKISASVPLSLPDPAIFELPEKVLQFGTGVLLRGLPDYFIDKANRKGIFNGRIVVVKSTDKGDTTAFNTQDALYTICIRGIENQQKVEENIVCSAISRVLTAQSDWAEVLKTAASPDLQIITSNTTESGIEYTADDIKAQPPLSFPGKLLAVLHHRFLTFEGDKQKGLVIVPTELISDNASKLKAILLKLATENQLEEDFMNWLSDSNTFCNTLVDRIVPGKPDLQTREQLFQSLGYEDDLLICAEVYRLWAIEGDQKVKDILSFAQADEGLIVTPNITLFKELKLRLLNGTHTLACAAACLAGFETVHDAMQDAAFADFVEGLMQQDLAPAIPYSVPLNEALAFSEKVLDRFRNPHIRHQWLSIATNYTMKLNMRVLPVLQYYVEQFNKVPEHIAFGFAAYLLLMKGDLHRIDDEQSERFRKVWAAHSTAETAQLILSDQALWETDLSGLPGFLDAVTNYMNEIEEKGIKTILKNSIHKGATA